MTSPITYPIDDKMLDDAALWAVIDSAAAASLSSSTKLRNTHTPRSSTVQSNQSPYSATKLSRNPRVYHSPENGEVLQEDSLFNQRPHKMARICTLETRENNPLALVQHVQRSPVTPKNSLPNPGRFSMEYSSPVVTMGSSIDTRDDEVKETVRNPMFSPFRSVSLFKEYQNAAMAILEKSDFTMISGNPFIKKSGWRKISCFFNLSFEIKDKTIEFDNNRNVLRAEFVARAHMQCGRYSDGWGSCERNEKRFIKPNHDIPSTAETRAKNKACQDLLGIGEYRPGGASSHGQR
ncbi:uncharacterized protein LOC124936159 [Impatiens glandulifera]|uniref:uncharacterized protein LOC124936159 n=1 Tax=Impatiens glandulifera TaxID=253017 RepID=UPI001FB0D40A|nr:uncharacterized protein LOC124936159 [Impatiens glandulifera]